MNSEMLRGYREAVELLEARLATNSITPEMLFEAGARWMQRELHGVCSGRVMRYGKVETLRELMAVGEALAG